MTRIYKTITNPATGRMETVEDTSEASADAKLKQMRREVREMIEGNVAFHVDPNAAPVRPAPSCIDKALEFGFEDWLSSTFPSGCVEEVQRQWEASHEYRCILEDHQEGMAAAKVKPSGWIEWAGGECPCIGQKVLLALRGGASTSCGYPAYYYKWRHSGSKGDIVAYKVVA